MRGSNLALIKLYSSDSHKIYINSVVYFYYKPRKGIFMGEAIIKLFMFAVTITFIIMVMGATYFLTYLIFQHLVNGG